MRTLKLIVEYDGTDFCGYQRQGQGVRTVQSVLEEALAQLTRETVTVYAAGRTDTGVHALGQVVSFQTNGSIPTERLAIALNSVLPPDTAIVSATEMPDGFHARFSAKSRTYGYFVWTRRTRSAIWGRYSTHLRRPVDLPRMREAARTLIGAHDFAAYAKAGGDPGPTTVRDLQRIAIRRRSDSSVFIVVRANAFLRSMVRNIVGVLLEVGMGDLPITAPAEILATTDRSRNPVPPALPQGLCLLRVKY